MYMFVNFYFIFLIRSHVYQSVSGIYKMILMDKLAELLIDCGEFMGAQGVGYILPLLVQGVVDISDACGGEIYGIMATDVDAEEDNQLVVSRKAVQLINFIRSQTDAKYASATFSWKFGLSQSSLLHSIICHTIHNNLQLATADLGIKSSNAVATADSKSILVVKEKNMISSSYSLVSNSDVRALQRHLSVIIGGCYLLGTDGVASLLKNENADTSTSETVYNIGASLVYLLVFLMLPSANPDAKLLEERKYLFSLHDISTSSSIASQSVTAGYYRVPWEHVSGSGGDDDSSCVKHLIRKLCAVAFPATVSNDIDKTKDNDSISGIDFLLDNVRSMEHRVHKLWRRDSSTEQKFKGSSFTEKKENNQTSERKERNEKRHKRSRKKKVSDDAVGNEAKCDEDDISESDRSKYAIYARLQVWKQSVSVWKLLGYAALSCSLPTRIDVGCNASGIKNRKKTALPCCAVCGVTNGVPPPSTDITDTRLEAITPLSRCMRCRTVYYCSKEHQTQHWIKGHKLQCIQMGERLEKLKSGQIVDSSHGTENSEQLYLNKIIDPERILTSSEIQKLKQGSKTPKLIASVKRLTDRCLHEMQVYLSLSAIQLPHVTSNDDITVIAADSAIVVARQYTSNTWNGNNRGIENGVVTLRNNDSSVVTTITDVKPGEPSSEQHLHVVPLSYNEYSYMTLRIASIVECLAHCAFVLQKHFDDYLMKCLYPLLELSVDNNYLIKQAAVASLGRIALYGGHADVKALMR
jgi:hypothetical protein